MNDDQSKLMPKANLRKTFTDYLYNVAYQILVIILPIVTTPYVARVLGAEGVGQHAFVHTVAHYFLLFALMGVSSYGSRAIAQVRDDSDKTAYVFSGIVYLQWMLTSLMLVLYTIYVVFISGQHQLLAAIKTLYVLSAALDINWFFFGLEQFKLMATRRIVVKLITVASVFIFVRQRSDLWIYTLIMALDFVVVQGYLWFIFRKFTQLVRVPLRDTLAHLRGTALLFIPSISTYVYRSISKLLLGLITGMVALGLFEYSERVILVSLGLLQALGIVMLPKMTAFRAQNQEELGKRYLRGSMQFAMLLTVGVAFGYAAIAPEFSVVFFGPEFQAAIELMQGLSITMFFIAWANVIRMQFLIPNNLERVLIASTFGGIAMNVPASLLLIPLLGAMGAVVAGILTELTVALIQTWKVREQLEIKQYFGDSVPFLLSGLIMFIVVRLIGNHFGASISGVVIQVLSGMVVFTICTALLLLRSQSPLSHLMKRVLKKRKK